MHEGGGRWVGSNKVVELKKKKKFLRAATCFSAVALSYLCVVFLAMQHVGS